jgi:hypothetical protein
MKIGVHYYSLTVEHPWDLSASVNLPEGASLISMTVKKYPYDQNPDYRSNYLEVIFSYADR